MHKRTLVLAVLCAILPLNIRAVEPDPYPTGSASTDPKTGAIITTNTNGALMDVNCADSKNGMSVVAGVFTQTTGTGVADGFCDSDQRIRTGLQNADVLFGPFTPPTFARILEIVAEPTLLGGSGTYTICLAITKPYEPPTTTPPASGDLVIKSCAPNVAATTAQTFGFGSLGLAAAPIGGNTRNVGGLMELPKSFYILLDIAGGGGSSSVSTATSYTGNLSLIWDN